MWGLSHIKMFGLYYHFLINTLIISKQFKLNIQKYDWVLVHVKTIKTKLGKNSWMVYIVSTPLNAIYIYIYIYIATLASVW